MSNNSDQSEKKDVQKKKGDEGQHHQGGPNASNKTTRKHAKDESDGADKNTTKKQGNSI